MNRQNISDPNGFIKISAYDHRDSLKKFIPEEYFAKFKALLTDVLGPYTTGVLVDPFFGGEAIQIATQKHISLILSREESGYTDNPDGRLTKLHQFNSEKLKQMGASAVKLLLYYNPDAANKADQIAIVKNLYIETTKAKLPLVLEPITYEIPGKRYFKAEAIYQTLQDVKDYADVLKIEYPTDVKNAELSAGKNYLMQITKLLNDKPWVLLSRGDMNFEKYYEAVKISLECGGKGYAVGRAIWQEIADLKNFNEVVNFINTTGLARIKKLNTLFPDD